ncbi:Uncharacterised protein [Mycobacteroides abscessus subsp. abscessus]|nr:Uncharacterised protein [Mycobacteroides abscessus subsp. abscessus]SKX40637.1 Uncharacterised protein [Mycobacteroides abscessus subsp. abscessus]
MQTLVRYDTDGVSEHLDEGSCGGRLLRSDAGAHGRITPEQLAVTDLLLASPAWTAMNGTTAG